MVRKAKPRKANRGRRARNTPDRRRVDRGGRRYRDLIERLQYNSVVLQDVGIYIERHDILVEWSPCWLWIGACDRTGYGRVPIWDEKVKQARNRQAHRVSYFAHKGLPYKKRKPTLMHQCDRRGCIHPDHVDPGTHKLNMQEMVARGRHANAAGSAANNYGRAPGED